jgi:hypothetical protein
MNRLFGPKPPDWQERKVHLMEIVFEVASTKQHFEQILQLQKQNLFSAISEEHQSQQGFVFAEHTMPLLNMMAAHLPQVIAVSNGKVVGYNVTEVSARNSISLQAHQRMGFEVVSTYHDGKELWNVMVWDFETGGAGS